MAFSSAAFRSFDRSPRFHTGKYALFDRRISETQQPLMPSMATHPEMPDVVSAGITASDSRQAFGIMSPYPSRDCANQTTCTASTSFLSRERFPLSPSFNSLHLLNKMYVCRLTKTIASQAEKLRYRSVCGLFIGACRLSTSQGATSRIADTILRVGPCMRNRFALVSRSLLIQTCQSSWKCSLRKLGISSSFDRLKNTRGLSRQYDGDSPRP